jgi:hypothetical protein
MGSDELGLIAHFSVQLQLDNGDVLSRTEFDRWVARHAKMHPAPTINGDRPRRPAAAKNAQK